MNAPGQIFALRPGHAPIQLTHADDAALKDVQFSPYDRFSFTGWNGDKVSGWVTKPYGWRPGVKYPVVMIIHGGPQGSWEDSWSARWNPQVWAGWGYAVVQVDFHGSTGYGQAFTDAISGHWGDRPLEDLQKGWAAALQQNPWIDGGARLRRRRLLRRVHDLLDRRGLERSRSSAWSTTTASSTTA